MSLIQSTLPVKNYTESALKGSEPTNASKKNPAWVKPTIYTAISVGGVASSFFLLYQAGFFSSQNPVDPNPIADRTILPFRSPAPDSSTSLPSPSSLPNLFCPIQGLTDFDQNGNAIDKLNFDIQPGTGLYSSKVNSKLFPTEDIELVTNEVEKRETSVACLGDLIGENLVGNKVVPNSLLTPDHSTSAPDSSTSLSALSSLPNLFCPIPSLTDFDQNRNVLARQTAILKVPEKTENGETSLARLRDLIGDDNLLRNKVDQIARVVWDVLTTPILERPSLPLIGTVVSLLQVSTQFKNRSEQEKRYLRSCLNTFLRCFRKPSTMPEGMRIHLAMGMNLNTEEDWKAYIQKLENLIEEEGLRGFKRLWEPVLTADLPVVSEALRTYKEMELRLQFSNEEKATIQPLLEQIFREKEIEDSLPSFLKDMGEQAAKDATANLACWRFQNMMRTMLNPGPGYDPEMAADYEYYSYLKDVRYDMGEIDFMLSLTSIFKVERIVEYTFSFLLNAVLLPSAVLLVNRKIYPMF